MRKYNIKKLKQPNLPHGEDFIEVKKEIKPLDTDLETGEILNLTKNTQLVPTGEKKNIQEEINSYREQADINAIIKRVQATGDTSALNKKLGVYEDITGAPESIIEAADQSEWVREQIKIKTAELNKLKALNEQKESTENGTGTDSGVSSLDSSSD